MEDLLGERWDSSRGEAELKVKGHRKGGQQDWAEAWPSPSCFLSGKLQNRPGWSRCPLWTEGGWSSSLTSLRDAHRSRVMSSTRDRRMSSLGQPPKNHQIDASRFPLLAAGEEGTSG